MQLGVDRKEKAKSPVCGKATDFSEKTPAVTSFLDEESYGTVDTLRVPSSNGPYLKSEPNALGVIGP